MIRLRRCLFTPCQVVTIELRTVAHKGQTEEDYAKHSSGVPWIGVTPNQFKPSFGAEVKVPSVDRDGMCRTGRASRSE
jgi:hypothetical protein